MGKILFTQQKIYNMSLDQSALTETKVYPTKIAGLAKLAASLNIKQSSIKMGELRFKGSSSCKPLHTFDFYNISLTALW